MTLSACSSSSEDDEPQQPIEEEEEYQEIPHGSGWNDEDGYSRYFKSGGWYTFIFDNPGNEGICKSSTFSYGYDSKATATQQVNQLKTEGKTNVVQDGRIVTYDEPQYLGNSYTEIRNSFGNVQEKYLSGYWLMTKSEFVLKSPDGTISETHVIREEPEYGWLYVFNGEDHTFEKYSAQKETNGYGWEKRIYGDYTLTIYNWGGQGVLLYNYYDVRRENEGYINKEKLKGKFTIRQLDAHTLITFSEGTWGPGETSTETEYYTRTDESVLSNHQ